MTGLLRRLAAQARERAGPAQPCELCGEPLPAVHRHLLELPARELRCACRACQVLFDHAAAGGGHYRLVPELRRRVGDVALDAAVRARLGAPVRTAFLVAEGDTESAALYYPSPAGAVRAPVDRFAWEALRQEHPVLRQLRPDVEALLADRDRGAWIVPVDDCYALVGIVRARWRGLTGGPDVRRHVEQFFTDLNDRSVAVPVSDNDWSPA